MKPFEGNSLNRDCHNTYIFYFCCYPHNEPLSLVSQKFFSKTSSGTHLGSELIIPVLGFVNDSGNTITSFPTGYSYTNLYINGVIQQNGTFTVVPSALLVIGEAS
ncbi:DUF4183 domain-containing protein [Alicyclobacillus fastidiosus]|uniref:DUF4183 domain-containing protein n=1 Tax=Alicyclobacillus fastidiosus TaxID=392011 RepID=UPI003D66EFE8